MRSRLTVVALRLTFICSCLAVLALRSRYAIVAYNPGANVAQPPAESTMGATAALMRGVVVSITEAATKSSTQRTAVLIADADENPLSLRFVQRSEAIVRLQGIVARRQAEQGLSFRRAMKAVAAEVGLTNIAVRRLIDLYPDN